MKRIISALLAAVALITISSLSSCGSGEILTGVYSSEQIALPDGFAADTVIRAADGFAVVSTRDEDGVRRFVRLDGEMNVTDSGEITTSNVAFLPDGDIVYAEGADILRSGNKPLAVPYTGMTKPGMVDDTFAGYTETSPGNSRRWSFHQTSNSSETFRRAEPSSHTTSRRTADSCSSTAAEVVTE